MRTYHEDDGIVNKSEIPLDSLKKVVPEDILFEMKGAIEMFSINTILRLSHFLSQVEHESGHYKFVSENLNYSSAGLMGTFPKYFPEPTVADHYARQPQKIANRVYANRMGNGDETTGDGWKYRGRGYIQLTGKDNYSAMAKDTQEPTILTNPDILTNKKYACLSAGWFWRKNKLNDISDKGSDEATIKEVTLKVNGGYNGLSDRKINFNRIYAILNAQN